MEISNILLVMRSEPTLTFFFCLCLFITQVSGLNAIFTRLAKTHLPLRVVG